MTQTFFLFFSAVKSLHFWIFLVVVLQICVSNASDYNDYPGYSQQFNTFGGSHSTMHSNSGGNNIVIRCLSILF